MTLPEKLSDCLELALRDLEACEQDPAYEVDMKFWHKPQPFRRLHGRRRHGEDNRPRVL
jgi:hypothetical protein